MIDNFSSHSDLYARFRPTYPFGILERVAALLPQKERAWDCATGNGQAAAHLAQLFHQVEATDISANQLAHAVQQPNIRYSEQSAEQTQFPNQYFDLIVVAQAIHWFQFEQFYQEVRRTSRQHGLLLVLGYGMLTVNNAVDEVILNFYHHVIGTYWDKERRYIDEGYRTIPFPFAELPMPQEDNSYRWTVDHLLAYLRTWSAVKHYQKQNGSDPLLLVEADIRKAWGDDGERVVHFPIIGRLGRVSP